MASVCAAPQTVVLSSSFHTGSSSAKLKSCAALAAPLRQDQNGTLKVSASSEGSSSRREAMAVVGGAGLAGLLFLLPVGSAEAISGLPRSKPESRKKIREELEKVKEQAVKFSDEGKKNVQNLAKIVSDRVGKK